MATSLHESFLQLVRLGIGHTETTEITEKVDWVALKALAERQGLSAVILDALNSDGTNLADSMPVQMKLVWIGEALQGERQFKAQWKAVKEMAEHFDKNGIKTYVLKGFVVSECYPKPEHRVSVDMDCFLLPKEGDEDIWEKGNKLMEEKGYTVGRGFYKNSSFHLPGLLVENHRFLTPFRGNKKLKQLEMLLQSELWNDGSEDRFEGVPLYRPPVMVSALFLIEHAYSHFLHEGLTWRMVIDWAMFRKRHQKEIDWMTFDALVDDFGFKKFYDSYHRLGQYLIGEVQEFNGLNVQDKRMLEDVWAPLDLHETLHGFTGKLALAGNTFRARWKYRYFTDLNWMKALWIQVNGFLFEKHPELY